MLRLDRFLTLHFFRHLTKVLPQSRGIRIPILMYHSISDEPEKGHPYFWINTSPKRFAEHMKFLHDNNYKVIDLSEAVRLIEHVPMQPNKLNKPKKLYKQGKYVVLTFDDGYMDFYTNAFPVLRQYDFSATVFLPTDFIGNGRPGIKGKDHLNWDEIRDLQAQGINFGSHTITHPQLKDLKWERVEYEIRKSKEIIEEKIGQPVESFSYPHKFPEQDKKFVKALHQFLLISGYKSAVSTRIGTINEVTDTFCLKRIPINSRDKIPLFKAKLEGAYDWLNTPQRLLKSIRNHHIFYQFR